MARERPLLCGYLMATVGARTSDGNRVEIKLDERRSERRQQRKAREPEPERRRGERRHRPSYATDLRARGYATVVQSDVLLSSSDQPSREPAMVWRSRSAWWHRAARRNRVRWGRWGLIALLLTVLGVAVVVGRSVH